MGRTEPLRQLRSAQASTGIQRAAPLPCLACRAAWVWYYGRVKHWEQAMTIARQVFGFFVRDKIAAMSDPVTWGYALAGLFVLGLAVPSLGLVLYLSFAFLAWAVLSGKLTRSGIFFFWLPFFAVVGLAVWQPVFPANLGIVLAVLMSFLVSNLFYLLLSRVSFPGSRVLLLALAFFAFEYVFHSLPVLSHVELPLLLGLVADHLPVVRLVVLLGSSLSLFAVVALISAVVSMAISRRVRALEASLSVALIALLALANAVAGASVSKDGFGVRVAAVQGSTRQSASGLAGQEYLDYVRARYTRLIEDVEADVFLFPEVPLAIYYPAREEYNGQIFVDLARSKNALIVPLVSEYRMTPDGSQQRYITSLVVGPEGIIGASSKRNLVPFGEARQVSPGDDYSPVTTPFGQVGLAICYDFNAPHIIGKLKANGAEVILAPFNDSGFGVIFHRMHSHYSILRALEYNVPIIVANEDGISQIVDRDGRVHASLGIGEQGVITAWVSLEHNPSYYLLAGRWAEYVLLLTLALQLGGQTRRSRAAGRSR